MASVRFLDLVSPFAPHLPEVAAPQRKIPFNQRLLWTGVVLLIFLVMSEVPLYGIVSSDQSDPIMWLRMMLASNRGTLMELGITPIMSSSMVFQLLMATGIVEVNTDDRRDRELLQTAQKFLALILSLGQATVYVLTGMYGVPSSLGIGVCLLLIMQLVFAAFIVILLDELLQKGYGLGSGTSLFVATNTCEQLTWRCFSPNTVTGTKGPEFEGAFLALVHLFFTRKSKKNAIIEAFTRANMPNMFQVLVTLGLFLVVVYLQRVRVDLPIRSAKARGIVNQYPIKLFYTSSTPIMLQSALSQNVVMLSQMLFSRYPSSMLTRVLGIWEANRSGSGQLIPTHGVAYYMLPPQSWYESRADPFKTLVYVGYVVGICAVFSKLWLEVSGTGPREIARQFRDQELQIVGSKESAYKELKRLIPIAATLGGAATGLLSVVSDLLGTLGSGTGILLAVTTIYGYVDVANNEIGANLF